MKGWFTDDEFGRVLVYARRGLRNATVRWQGDNLRMTVPAGMTLDESKAALAGMRAGVRALRRPTTPHYAVGRTIACLGFEIAITGDSHNKGYVTYGITDRDHAYVRMAPGDDPNSEGFKHLVSDALNWIAERMAVTHLLPLAADQARRLGIQLPPERLTVGRGLRKLGHCTRAGVIQLSRKLVFLPTHLALYVVCHELAHLTHMNHSPQFHALVDRYTGGREAELEAELRKFVWPVVS